MISAAAASDGARTELLLEVGRRISGELDIERAIHALGETLVPRFADACTIYLFEPSGMVRCVAAYRAGPPASARAREELARLSVPLDAPSGVGRTLRTGETEVIADLTSHVAGPGPSALAQKELLDAGARSVVHVALRAHGRAVGAITVARGQAAPLFTADDVVLLEDVSHRAAATIENARLMQELRASEARVSAHNAALLRLARANAGHSDLRATIARITEESARTMGIARVSVWLYDDERARIRCIDLFEAGSGRHSAGLELAAEDFPGYFAALAQERTIAAHDARTDARTREFAASYLEPLGITSMLDAPLRVGGATTGVLCHEHVGPMRTWRPEEEIFAGALADLVSLAMEAERRGAAQGQLQESEERFTRMAHDAPIGIWLTDDRMANVYNNRWRCELLGCGQEDLLGSGWMQFVHPDDLKTEFTQVAVRTAAREPFQTQHRLRAPDGSWRHVINVATPRFGAGGAFLGYIGAEFDVTDRIEAQQALAAARRELAQADKLSAMGSLVSGVAHEVRTPLAYIANHAALLETRARAAGDQELREHTAAILEGVDRVNALVVDLRRFVRSERAPREPAPLHEVVGIAARMFEATHRSVRLQLSLAPTAPVLADRSQLQQVVLNLLENAADASPPGAPVRLATREGEHGPELVISDDGPGIPPDVQAVMFEPFYTTKKEGTGLGLSIVRRIIEAHGARIRCDSQAGRGSTFIVSFPLPASR